MYPIMLKIEDKIVSVVGGGEVALRKVLTLLKYKTEVRVISPEFILDFEYISDKVKLIKENYSDGLIKGSFLVVAATSSKDVNKSIASFCKENNILCNVVDDPEISDFLVPSSIKRGSLVISVSTSGKSPALASKIRKELEEMYPGDYEEYVDLLGEIREVLQQKCLEISLRKKILKELLKLNYKELVIWRDELEDSGRF